VLRLDLRERVDEKFVKEFGLKKIRGIPINHREAGYYD
jgi:hypothetical protein